MVKNLNLSSPLFIDTETYRFFSGIRLVQLFQEHWDSVQLFDTSAVSLRELWEEIKDCKAVFHNYAYDGACFVNDLGLPTAPFLDFEDTLLLSKQAFPLWEGFSLDECFTQILGYDPYEKVGDKKILQKSFSSTKRKDMSKAPLTQQQLQYAALDVFHLPKLYNAVKHVADDYTYLLDKKVLIHTLRWQKLGMPVDEIRRLEIKAKCEKEVEELTAKLPSGLNINSFKQVREVLGDDRSDTFGLIKHELEGNTIATTIKDKRKVLKKLNFLERYAFPRIRGYYNYTAISGRARCNGSGDKDGTDNLTQIPRELKYCFGFPKDDPRFLVYADYSQLELRTICALTGDPVMKEIFDKGVDIHTQTAETMFGVKADEVTKFQRVQAKVCNFGLLYCAGPYALIDTFLKDPRTRRALPYDEAMSLCQAWRSVWPGIYAWHGEARRYFKSNGYNSFKMEGNAALPAKTLWGRNYKAGQVTEWCGIANQGFGAEVAKLAMHYLCSREPNVKICAFIHDSFTLEADSLDEAKRLSSVLAQSMIDAWFETSKIAKIVDLVMPVKVQVGKNWGEIDSDDYKPDFEFSYPGTYETSQRFKDVQAEKEGERIQIEKSSVFEEVKADALFPNKHLEIDADTIFYMAAQLNEDTCLEEAIENVKSYISRLKEITGCESLNIHLTGSKCFRYALFEDYKAKRRLTARPTYLKELKEYFAENFGNVFLHNEWEADDAVVSAKLNNPSCVVCASDKDVLNGVEGIHFNYMKNEIVETPKQRAIFYPFYQAIVGDSADGIPGVPGIGAKKALQFVREGMTEAELWEGVLRAYCGDEEAAKLAIRLTMMTQTKTGHLVLWEAPNAGGNW